MASVVREFIVAAPIEKVWEIIGDFAQGPLRFAPGIFVGCELEAPDTRILRFSDGTEGIEQLVSRDEKTHRIVWRWVDEAIVHDNTIMQVMSEDQDTSRIIWIHDVLPHDAEVWLAPTMDKLIPVFQYAIKNISMRN